MQMDEETTQPPELVKLEPPDDAEQARGIANGDINHSDVLPKTEPGPERDGDTSMTEIGPETVDGTKDDRPEEAVHAQEHENGKEAADDNGEVLIEGEEDTLIY